jgi:hypothetical protein
MQPPLESPPMANNDFSRKYFLPLGAMALIFLSGCGATYTKLDQSKAENSPASIAADCPDGIDYKSGQCR